MRELEKSTASRRLELPVQLLIVEDEPVLRSSMARGLAKLSGVEVWTAASVAEARRLLDSVRPQLVLCDLDLPDGVGLDVLAALERRSVNVPVLFISAYVSTYRRSIPSRANIQVREKPVLLSELRKLVQQQLALPPLPESPFSPSDYVQLAWMGHHSVRLEFEQDGEPAGTIVVCRGELWSAVDSQGEGEAALRRLLFSRCTLARCVTVREEPCTRIFTESSQTLLMEAARVFDEEARASQATAASGQEADPQPGPAPEPSPGQNADRKKAPCFEELFEEGVDALLRKDYRAACDSFSAAAALRPEDTRVAANLKRLRVLGFGPKGEAP